MSLRALVEVVVHLESFRNIDLFYQGLKALPAANGKRLYRQQVIDELKSYLKPGDKVYTILRHVSASGMQRRISLVIPYVLQDGRTGITTLDYSAVIAIDAKLFQQAPHAAAFKLEDAG